VVNWEWIFGIISHHTDIGRAAQHIVNAPEKELCTVHGIGKNIAAGIVKVFNTEYMQG